MKRIVELTIKIKDSINVHGSLGVRFVDLIQELDISHKIAIFIAKSLFQTSKYIFKIGEDSFNILDLNPNSSIPGECFCFAVEKFNPVAFGIESYEEFSSVSVQTLEFIGAAGSVGCTSQELSKLLNLKSTYNIVDKFVYQEVVIKRSILPIGQSSRIASYSTLLRLKKFASNYYPDAENVTLQTSDDIKRILEKYFLEILDLSGLDSIPFTEFKKYWKVPKSMMKTIKSLFPEGKGNSIYFTRQVCCKKSRSGKFLFYKATCLKRLPKLIAEEKVAHLKGFERLRNLPLFEQLTHQIRSQNGMKTSFISGLGYTHKRSTSIFGVLGSEFNYPIIKLQEGKTIASKALPKANDLPIPALYEEIEVKDAQNSSKSIKRFQLSTKRAEWKILKNQFDAILDNVKNAQLDEISKSVLENYNSSSTLEAQYKMQVLIHYLVSREFGIGSYAELKVLFYYFLYSIGVTTQIDNKTILRSLTFLHEENFLHFVTLPLTAEQCSKFYINLGSKSNKFVILVLANFSSDMEIDDRIENYMQSCRRRSQRLISAVDFFEVNSKRSEYLDVAHQVVNLADDSTLMDQEQGEVVSIIDHNASSGIDGAEKIANKRKFDFDLDADEEIVARRPRNRKKPIEALPESIINALNKLDPAIVTQVLEPIKSSTKVAIKTDAISKGESSDEASRMFWTEDQDIYLLENFVINFLYRRVKNGMPLILKPNRQIIKLSDMRALYAHLPWQSYFDIKFSDVLLSNLRKIYARSRFLTTHKHTSPQCWKRLSIILKMFKNMKSLVVRLLWSKTRLMEDPNTKRIVEFIMTESIPEFPPAANAVKANIFKFMDIWSFPTFKSEDIASLDCPEEFAYGLKFLRELHFHGIMRQACAESSLTNVLDTTFHISRDMKQSVQKRRRGFYFYDALTLKLRDKKEEMQGEEEGDIAEDEAQREDEEAEEETTESKVLLDLARNISLKCTSSTSSNSFCSIDAIKAHNDKGELETVVKGEAKSQIEADSLREISSIEFASSDRKGFEKLVVAIHSGKSLSDVITAKAKALAEVHYEAPDISLPWISSDGALNWSVLATLALPLLLRLVEFPGSTFRELHMSSMFIDSSTMKRLVDFLETHEFIKSRVPRNSVHLGDPFASKSLWSKSKPKIGIGCAEKSYEIVI